MVELVTFLAVCCLIGISHVEAECNRNGTFDGWKTIVGTGSGYFYITKSTSFYENVCTFSQPPTNTTTPRKRAPFKSGYKDTLGDWQHQDGIAVGLDQRIVYIYPGNVKKKYIVLYSDYKNCYITYKTKELELWVHKDASDQDALGCCNTIFGQELRERKLQGTTLRKMSKDCEPYDVQ
ncbi:allergen Arg r 1-like [Ornithodoros turicata]|uniref:allergen Arg r 1-like n=1 Tax=Ornithodoros turicata TaxID=34597 RepID=UPI0031396A6C